MTSHEFGIRREIERIDRLIAAFIKIEHDFRNETHCGIIAQLQIERVAAVDRIRRLK